MGLDLSLEMTTENISIQKVQFKADGFIHINIYQLLFLISYSTHCIIPKSAWRENLKTELLFPVTTKLQKKNTALADLNYHSGATLKLIQVKISWGCIFMAVYTTKICMRAKFFLASSDFRREMMVGLRFAFWGIDIYCIRYKTKNK